jgi:hypothetical protein
VVIVVRYRPIGTRREVQLKISRVEMNQWIDVIVLIATQATSPSMNAGCAVTQASLKNDLVF